MLIEFIKETKKEIDYLCKRLRNGRIEHLNVRMLKPLKIIKQKYSQMNVVSVCVYLRVLVRERK